MGLSGSIIREDHACTIRKEIDAATTEKVSPKAPWYVRMYYRMRCVFVISESHPQSKEYFRSKAQIKIEIIRQIRSSEFLIIHPLSIFNFYRTRLLIILWMIAFFKNAFSLAFYTHKQGGRNTGFSFWWIFESIIDSLLGVDILINFVVGYRISKSKEIVLDHRKIVINYLKTFFVPELIGTVPVSDIVDRMIPNVHANVLITLSLLRIFRFIRLGTMLTYIQEIGQYLQVNDSIIILICQSFMTVLYIHWLGCFLYVIPLIEYYNTGVFPPDSWVSHARIEPYRNEIRVGDRYIKCILSAVCHFFNAHVGMYISRYSYEQLYLSLALTLGFIYMGYVTALVIQIFSSVNISESKYEELIHQLKEYMRSKKLPYYFRQRLMAYYENKFQKYFFKEQAILDSLSEHLRCEIFLHTCRTLITKVNLFQGLSKDIVGAVLGYMTPEVYLVNDVVAKVGSPCEDVWFISYGTIAIFTERGNELVHLEDGQYFGATTGVSTDASTCKYNFNAVTVETTELFRISRKDFERASVRHHEFRRRLTKFADKYSLLLNKLADEKYASEDERKSIIEELRQGRILERIKERT